MHVDFAFICDYAESREKINALGIGFDRINAPKLPARHPHFSVVTQLRFNRTEIGTKDVKIHLIDADGKDIIPSIGGQITVKEPLDQRIEITTRLVMEFGNVEFKNYGDYSVKVIIATQEAVSIPLSVVQPPLTI